MSKIMEILNISKNWVMKWSVLGETGEFSVVVFTGSQFNIRESADDMQSFHDCIMMSSWRQLLLKHHLVVKHHQK